MTLPDPAPAGAPPEPVPPAVAAWVGLGANLGDAQATVQAAVRALAALPGCQLAAHSACYGSAPVQADGPDYVNAVALLHTTLTPEDLLAALQRTEQAFGRQRPYPNAPRTLDLDLLLYAQLVRGNPLLTLPHPRLHQRAFVLLPLLELDPALQAPGLGALAAYREGCADQPVWRLPAWPERHLP